jgi:D-alanyl-D-alanine carboxypeptidase
MINRGIVDMRVSSGAMAVRRSGRIGHPGRLGSIVASFLGSLVVAAFAFTGVPASAAGTPSLVLSAPASAIAGIGFQAAVTLTQDSAPVASASVTLTAKQLQHPDVTLTVASDESGSALASLVLPVRGDWTIVASYIDGANTIYSNEVVVAAAGQAVAVSINAPTAVTSEVAFKATVSVVSAVDGSPIAGVSATFHRSSDGVQPSAVIGKANTDSFGHGFVTSTVWKASSITVSIEQGPIYNAAISAPVRVTARPVFAVVTYPRGAPLPKVRFSDAPRAQGSGANPLVTPIPDAVWASMQGLTWHKGCIARSSLRYITVNYIGFDGFRYRGSIILASGVAKPAVNVFTRLYAMRYPIRSMFLVDRYGKAPHGYPGANDYASMASDNTTGFNCRYVVGKESRRAMSPHAWGSAIDINTWENPYYSARGPYPNSWWLPRTRASRAMLTASSPAVKAFRAAGFTWGGSYMDYQHFQP